MNIFEKELLKYIKDSFHEEINENIIEIATNRDEPQKIIAQETDAGEFEYKAIESSESWMVEIVKKTIESKHIRVVIKSPDLIMINRISDHQSIIKAMVEKAKNILISPPFGQYVNQGLIQFVSEENDNIEFVPRDKL
jgi:hypothetical protein